MRITSGVWYAPSRHNWSWTGCPTIPSWAFAQSAHMAIAGIRPLRVSWCTGGLRLLLPFQKSRRQRCRGTGADVHCGSISSPGANCPARAGGGGAEALVGCFVETLRTAIGTITACLEVVARRLGAAERRNVVRSIVRWVYKWINDMGV